MPSNRDRVPSAAGDAVGQLLRAVTGRGYDDPITCCDVDWLSHGLIWPHFSSVVVGLDVA